MGLILEDDGYAVLSDILGDEDHLGDMDFKVAGSAEGITALQMDIKVGGVTEEIMGAALAQAREGRLGILDEMAKALSTARPDINAHAPRITKLTIPKTRSARSSAPAARSSARYARFRARRSTSRTTAP